MNADAIKPPPNNSASPREASTGTGAGAPGPQPFSILIAALGGEGGGVLADWIVESAQRAGLPVSATSVPGVAQRTGATSYYIEFMRAPSPAGKAPVFALMPVPGRVDVLLASELLEAGRMIERGFVSPSRTLLIAARHRVYTTLEKMQMADGRLADERIHAAAGELAQRYLSLDLQAIVARHRTVISAVLFGALAGSGVLPWSRKVCEDAIHAGGIGIESSLAGFAEAFDTAAAASPVLPTAAPALPAALGDTVALAEAKLTDYQDGAYAQLYRQRIDSLLAAASAGAAHEEAARQLALWMAYEDAIRVADLKTRAARFAKVRAEAQADAGSVVEIREHLSPSLEEIAAIVPRRIGLWLRARAQRAHPVGARGAGRTLATTSIHGFLLLRLLASMRRWRRASLRFGEEQAAIEAWLSALRHVLPRHDAYARTLAELPRLRKGYSDTWQRGEANYRRILATLVQPLIDAEAMPTDDDARRLREAIDAALADPQAAALKRSLDAVQAQPIHWAPRDSSRSRGAESTLT
jgi:indolepyruvate ferredoxin oxidoreductase beta subunit